MKALWRDHPVLLTLFVLAAGLSLGFALRALVVAVLWLGPPSDKPVAGWMTPRFIVKSYELPPEVVAEALAIPPESRPRQPLLEIARDQGRPVAELIEAIEAAILAQGEAP